MSKTSKKIATAKSVIGEQTAKRYSAIPSVATSVKAMPTAAPVVAVAAAPALAPTPVAVSPAPKPACVAPTATVTAAATKPAVHADAIAGLTRDLRNPDADTARESAIALGATSSPAAVDALISVLENTDGFYHSVVRSAAAESLAKLGDKRAVPALLHAVNDTMAEASAEAVRALAHLGDVRAIEPLIGVVRNANGFFRPVVRLAAVHALSRFDAPQAVAERARVAADAGENAVIRDAAGK